MSNWQSDYIMVNGLRLHYTRTGGDKPPLVLVHGFSDDGLCWNPVAEALESDYDIVMPDARGHGFSEAPERGYSPVEQAADLKGIIEALDLHKPLVLGHSMGAVTAMTLAGLYPDVPRAILLEDPPAWWYAGGLPKPTSPEQLAKMREEFALRKTQTREALIAKQRSETPTWSDAELGPWADSKLRLNPNIVELFEPYIPTSVDWAAVLPRITCPALLITADVDKWAIVSADGAAKLKAIIPQLEVVHIPDAGHCIHRDQMDVYMKAIRSFLSNL
ncbi:MAG: alpha/beta fold hydrolase [Anaerolineaceae bacterium]|nr:alpha/beta fold hydrolase [Anaerolineaceae bacterium]